jgi:hypothetical protein
MFILHEGGSLWAAKNERTTLPETDGAHLTSDNENETTEK